MSDSFPYLPLGPLSPDEQGHRKFRVWAPKPEKIELVTQSKDAEPTVHSLQAEGPYGYFLSESIPAPAGLRYGFRLNGDADKTYPDPVSRYQPDGVHGLSIVVDQPARPSSVSFKGIPLYKAVIYELHVGTFTEEGTLHSAIAKLDYLVSLGVNVIELLPLNQTPGDRNWGYDGVLPFAVFRAYGGPEALREFIDAAHERGVAVLIDVIYNHLGPEGNYLPSFFPIFTEQHKTPWGPAINMDDVAADGVRNFYLQNVTMWLEEYGADGLRLDAVHAIKDYGAEHFLASLSRISDAIATKEEREIILLAECDLNAPRYLQPRQGGGYGLTGQWVDEFHHAIHGLFTGETNGYYEDFGGLEHLERALRDGYVYTGQYSVHRKRNFGMVATDYQKALTPGQMVVFLQNHDQVGNRMIGDRLSVNLSSEQLLLAAGTYLLSAFTPLLFMGEEYGEKRPFPYFVHHGEDWLIEAVRKGRAAEFAAFQRPGVEVPDPQSEETFKSAKLSWELDEVFYPFYQTALRLRARYLTATQIQFSDLRVTRDGHVLSWTTGHGWTAYGNYGKEEHNVSTSLHARLVSGGAKVTDGSLQLPPFAFAFLTKEADN